ncbi:hypothetical protein LguiA_033085 [Lonicera macranthoides]
MAGMESELAIDIQAKDEYKLVAKIDEMLDKLEPPRSSECCIYRVTEKLRKVKEEAYTPDAVSIGPFHHGNEKFKSMELVKKRYFKKLVQRSTSSAANCSLSNYIEFVKNWEDGIRQCYSEHIEMDSDEFVTMILIDGCFIIELLVTSFYIVWRDEDHSLPSTCLPENIYRDLILLENQVPFFLLEGLFSLATASFDIPPLLYLTLMQFSEFNFQNKPPNFESVKHFTDLVLILFRPTSQRLPQRRETFQFLHSATELSDAGVKFQVSSSTCLHDIQFNKQVLEIPRFTVDQQTDTTFRNLVALEHYHYPHDTYIIDYFAFFDYLVNTPRDIDLLVQNEILCNWLDNSKDAADFYNHLVTNTTMNYNNFYFSRVSEDLNEYYQAPTNKLKATLKRDYFNTPWQTAATLAAITLLQRCEIRIPTAARAQIRTVTNCRGGLKEENDDDENGDTIGESDGGGGAAVVCWEAGKATKVEEI